MYEWSQNINGYEFTIGQSAYGEHSGKWFWSQAKGDTVLQESEPFDTACACQQDAILQARLLDQADSEYSQSDEYHQGMAVERRIDEMLTHNID